MQVGIVCESELLKRNKSIVSMDVAPVSLCSSVGFIFLGGASRSFGFYETMINCKLPVKLLTVDVAFFTKGLNITYETIKKVVQYI